MSVNKTILVGHNCNDIEAKYSATGTAVVNFTVATNEKWKDKNGEQQESTEFHRVVCFGRTAEICNEYLTKGRQVYIEGKLQTRQWETDSGEKRYTTEVVANVMQMLGSKGESQPQQDSHEPSQPELDDIPF